MSNTALNDITYNFAPLRLYKKEQGYIVDENELKKSKERSRELITKLRKNGKSIK